MRKIGTMIATAFSLGALLITAPTGAQAWFGAGAIADAAAGVPSLQQTQYYGGYRSYYAPRYYGGYGYRYNNGYGNSRDALDTCAYC